MPCSNNEAYQNLGSRALETLKPRSIKIPVRNFDRNMLRAIFAFRWGTQIIMADRKAFRTRTLFGHRLPISFPSGTI